MSTASLPKPKPLSALVVVEGKAEETFFDAFGTGLGLNLKIHAVCCNVYALYQWMKKDDLTLDIPKLIADHTHDPRAQQLLRQHYDAIYLIYDCDVQDTSYLSLGGDGEPAAVPDGNLLPTIDGRARANVNTLREMATRLNDEYDCTVGKLYLNYPMVESLWDADSFDDPLYQDRVVCLEMLTIRNAYKGDVKKRLLSWASRSVEEWVRDDFHELIRMNFLKAKQLVREKDYQIDQIGILDAQERRMAEKRDMYVLNTSVFIPLDQFGKKYPDYCKSIVAKRPEIDLTVIGTADVDLAVRAKLQGIMRVERNVDAIIFPESFCRTLPDYRNLLTVFEMTNTWSKQAIRSCLAHTNSWNCCYRADVLKSGLTTIDEVLTQAKGKVVLVKYRKA